MIKLNVYNIAPGEIEAIEAGDSGRPDYPYGIVVTTKNGRKYSVSYTDKGRRDEVVASMIRAVDVERERVLPPTLQTIRWAVQAEIDKLRPYLRRIEKVLKNGAGSDN